jgi:hypothetical protein
MKEVLKSKRIEVLYAYHEDLNMIVKGRTEITVEKKEIEDALAHIYGYG